MEEPKNRLFLPITDARIREQLIFGRDYAPDNYRGTCQYDSLSFRKAKELMERGYLSPDEKQNDAPTVQEFVDFMAAHDPDNWFLHGYVVSPYREDVRVSIEGIGSIGPITDHDMVDFLRTFRTADILTAEDGNPVFCWYD